MAKQEIKTKPHDGDVRAFIDGVDNAVRRADAERLLELYAEVTGEQPKMWGPSIIGYGSYHYRYESGREGDMCRGGFSPRKANLAIYLMGGYCNPETQTTVDALRARLGKHKVGASCLYITKLADVDMDALRDLVAHDWAWMNAKYPA